MKNNEILNPDIIVNRKFDKNNKLIYMKRIRDIKGKYVDIEDFYVYDSNGKLIKHKSLEGNEVLYDDLIEVDDTDNGIVDSINNIQMNYLNKRIQNDHVLKYEYDPDINKRTMYSAGLKPKEVVPYIEEFDEHNRITHFKSKSFEYWKEYNSNGKVAHYKDSNGCEEWYEYDKKGRIIYYKNSNGEEQWKNRDSGSLEINYKNSNGDEWCKKYDEYHHLIYSCSRKNDCYCIKTYHSDRYTVNERRNGYESWKEYDRRNNLLHFKDSEGAEQIYEYSYFNHGTSCTYEKIGYKDVIRYYNGKPTRYDADSELWYKNDILVHYKSPKGYEEWYNDEGNTIHYKDSEQEWWKGYDYKGNLIYYKNSNGYEEWYDYNKKGRLIYYKDSNGHEEWYDYNKNGRLIYKDSNGHEEWYNDEGNTIHYKDSEQEWWKGYDKYERESWYIDSNGFKYWKKYYMNSYITTTNYNDSNGFEWKHTFNRITGEEHYIDSNKKEWWRKYDYKTRTTEFRNSDG